MSQLLRVQNFSVSIDGFGAGEGQSLEAPFGHADRRGGVAARLPADLASWAFATASWGGRTEPGGSRGLDDYFTRDFMRNIGAEIMGRNKFGP
ncbi:MAG: dihydrofolate reductase family protein, partial [Acidimicrobiales bacterium]